MKSAPHAAPAPLSLLPPPLSLPPSPSQPEEEAPASAARREKEHRRDPLGGRRGPEGQLEQAAPGRRDDDVVRDPCGPGARQHDCFFQEPQPRGVERSLTLDVEVEVDPPVEEEDGVSGDVRPLHRVRVGVVGVEQVPGDRWELRRRRR